ncbi:hypothetical protein BHU61_12790 [Macrococcus epidermidis]|uniref:Lysine decarboxylase n=2 Tax=Macrococcus epidermidis TaxID=1902580 RepID=A0A327ZQ03_9STAP|nr:hypothetical protein BHU61_12790 [Macrococcus epidermidis]
MICKIKGVLSMKMYNAMIEHFKQIPISLHVPGHHYQTIGHLDNLELKYDVTEISGMDDYHHPDDIIKNSQLSIDKEGYDSRFLVNGTTVGLLAVILSFIEAGEVPSVAIMRNAHKSIYNAIALGKGSAYILPTNVSYTTKEYSGIDIGAIDKDVLPHIKLAVLTYPNYFGETYDIKAAIEYFHRYHIPVLIDEAHGAHFNISEHFPVSSLKYAADFVVQSYHKTLPAFTMSSVIHINHAIPEDIKHQINHLLSILQSSSPSYMLMLGLEHADTFYKHYKDRLFFKRRTTLLKALRKVFDVIEAEDPLKIMLMHEHYSGIELAHLLERYGIFTELSNEKFVLCVLPLWHENDRYLFELLIDRINNIKLDNNRDSNEVKSEMLYNQLDGSYIAQTSNNIINITLDKSIGRVCAEHIIPYPPGIPYILEGEMITEEHVQHVKSFISDGGKIHGIYDYKIRVWE